MRGAFITACECDVLSGPLLERQRYLLGLSMGLSDWKLIRSKKWRAQNPIFFLHKWEKSYSFVLTMPSPHEVGGVQTRDNRVRRRCYACEWDFCRRPLFERWRYLLYLSMSLSYRRNEVHKPHLPRYVFWVKGKTTASSSPCHLHTRLAVMYEQESVMHGGVATACKCDIL